MAPGANLASQQRRAAGAHNVRQNAHDELSRPAETRRWCAPPLPATPTTPHRTAARFFTTAKPHPQMPPEPLARAGTKIPPALQALCSIWGVKPATTKLIRTDVADWTHEQFHEDVYVHRSWGHAGRTRGCARRHGQGRAAFAEHASSPTCASRRTPANYSTCRRAIARCCCCCLAARGRRRRLLARPTPGRADFDRLRGRARAAGRSACRQRRRRGGRGGAGRRAGPARGGGRQRERRRGGAARSRGARASAAREPAPLLGALSDVGVRAVDELLLAQPLVLGLTRRSSAPPSTCGRTLATRSPSATWRSSLRRCCAQDGDTPTARRLKEFGVSAAAIKRAGRAFPAMFQLASEANLERTLAYLQGDEIGLTPPPSTAHLVVPAAGGLARRQRAADRRVSRRARRRRRADALRRHPQILGLSLDANLKPTARGFLEGIGVDVGAAVIATRRCSGVVERKLKPAVAFLRDEVGIADVGRAASAQPARSPGRWQPLAEARVSARARDGESGQQLGAYLALLSLSLEQNLRPTAALIDGVLSPPDAALRRATSPLARRAILPRLEYCHCASSRRRSRRGGTTTRRRRRRKALTLAAVTTESDAAFSRLGQPDEAFAAFKAARVRKEAGSEHPVAAGRRRFGGADGGADGRRRFKIGFTDDSGGRERPADPLGRRLRGEFGTPPSASRLGRVLRTKFVRMCRILSEWRLTAAIRCGSRAQAIAQGDARPLTAAAASGNCGAARPRRAAPRPPILPCAPGARRRARAAAAGR